MESALAARGIDVRPPRSATPRGTAGEQVATIEGAGTAGPAERSEAVVTLVADDVLATVRDRIVARLRRRGLSEAEVLRAALDEGLDAHQANDVLEQLRSWGYVDDASLAEQLLVKAQSRKGQGREAARRTLGERLIRADIVDQLLADIDDADELERAVELARRRAPQVASLGTEVAHRRLSGFLARRGYSGVIVRQAVDRALAESGGSGVRFTTT
ncbi:regulatory protein RecX [Mycetocola reblochoni]|uniref:Regulatory protein RecX n=1 Tax=Mycetocola reblochoni TaxID=331618 RepID=A0A3L6ZJF3_9MICO|nr:regulatory protein RecX [Mycetocola reblochoni]